MEPNKVLNNISDNAPDNTSDNAPDNTLDNMDMVIIIDKDKLPEELRDKFPQDLQDKLLELLQVNNNPPQRDKQSSTMFAVQHGSVVGNIYKDGIFPEEKSIQKAKIKREDDHIIIQDQTVPKKENVT